MATIIYPGRMPCIHPEYSEQPQDYGQSYRALDILNGPNTLHSPSLPLHVLDCTVLNGAPQAVHHYWKGKPVAPHSLARSSASMRSSNSIIGGCSVFENILRHDTSNVSEGL